MAFEALALVVTSIASPNRVLRELAAGSLEKGVPFIVVGDAASPVSFALDGCQFYSLEDQVKTGLKFAEKCPTRRYSRKNIGYLIAMQQGAEIIVETDDDNIPYDSFWQARQRQIVAPVVRDGGWLNVYRYFTDALIWPRGLPLNMVNQSLPSWDTLQAQPCDCPIQQGLANDNPDVDAIYRLLLPLPQSFQGDRQVALSTGTWCPFNSQNTSWWKDAFPLMYLPTYCSFRMTDIWRSFVAQAIAWVNDWSILFHEPTVWQERNEHNLMKDFELEIDGYLQNERLCAALAECSLKAGVKNIPENLLVCYEALVNLSLIDPQELNLLQSWLYDMKQFSQ